MLEFFGGLFGKAAEGISYIVLLKIVLNWLTEHPGFFLILLAVAVWVYMAWRHGRDEAKDGFRFNARSLNQIMTALLTLVLVGLGVANVFGWVSFNAADRKDRPAAPYGEAKTSPIQRPGAAKPGPYDIQGNTP